MKKTKKIILIITVLALLCSALFAVTASAAEDPAVTEGRVKLEAYRAATDADAKKQAFADLCNYLWTLDPRIEGYGAFRKEIENEQVDYIIEILEEVAKIAVSVSRRCSSI